MHIADGIVSGPILVGGAALAMGGVAVGLKKVDYDNIPKVAMLSAAFFVASLIHIPVGPGQVHLLLNGLVGIILGWAAFPALLVALLLQAVMFGYGGITVLGVNTVIMAVPAVLCHYAFKPFIYRVESSRLLMVIAAATSVAANIGSSVLLAMTLYFTNKEFVPVIGAILIAHVPVLLIEGPLVGAAVVYLKKVRPDIFST
jgi:cobalt/nickel transport system permease protein